MTRFILDIKDAPNMDELINYIKSLENVIDIKKDNACTLTNEQKVAIDEAIAELEAGKGIPHEEVMKRRKEKYPNLFK